jgi:hypothetical protein
VELLYNGPKYAKAMTGSNWQRRLFREPMDGVNWPTAANVHPGAEEEAVGATSAGKPVNAVREGWFVLSNRPRRVATRVNLVPGRAGMRFFSFFRWQY